MFQSRLSHRFKCVGCVKESVVICYHYPIPQCRLESYPIQDMILSVEGSLRVCQPIIIVKFIMLSIIPANELGFSAMHCCLLNLESEKSTIIVVRPCYLNYCAYIAMSKLLLTFASMSLIRSI